MNKSINKIFLLIFLFTFISINVKSQNREAIQKKFKLNGDSIYINSNLFI